MGTTDWKQKAIQRSKDIKKLNKKIKELDASRYEWKQKSIANKERADALEGSFKKLKENINKVLNETA